MPITRALVVALAIAACGSPNEMIDANTTPMADAPNPTGQFGDECSQHNDCVSGYCVEALGGVGGVCTRTCNNDCPADWNCRQVDIAGETTSLCVPNAPQLCLACASDSECGSDAACLDLDATGTCATKCTTSCPTGYKCAADPTGQHSGSFCQPVTGSCACTPAMNGATRACTSTNTIGTCYGTETCNGTTGWSACTAATATTESCNGNDDDCDFLIDEDVGGGQACTITVSGVGSCPGTRSCSGATGFVCEGQTPTPEACNYADDNCNGSIDEGFTGLGTLCSPGVGACQRYGSVRCNSAHTGVECSVTAGTPAPAELCNQIDDDCDTRTDEAFPTLGNTCSAGLGVCTRYGTTICTTDGLGTACSATAGTSTATETCNYLDDDCDGTVDDGYRNATTGAYDMTANCGGCGNNCATVYTGANSSGVCSTASGSPQCVMVCTSGYSDLNTSTADGCEFQLDTTAVYVSVTDAAAANDGTCGLGPTNSGAGNHPCLSITYGLMRSMMLGRPNVRVADGTYNEAVTLVSGKNLYGGYRAGTWERHLSTTSTAIQGVMSTGGNHDATVFAMSVTNSIFEGFVVRGSLNTKASGNSYAIYISGSDSTLVIRSNQIFAGRGGPGNAGTPGTNGLAGMNGLGSGTDTINGSYDAKITTGTGQCDTSNNRQYTNGGARTCGVTVVNGGKGGGNSCPVSSTYTQQSAANGFAGMGTGAGAGAQAGWDGVYETQGQDSTCHLPTQPMFGLDGVAGAPGTNAAAGAGCASAAGMVSGGNWINGSAAAGGGGTNGAGGGGGGAGGGGYSLQSGGNAKDRLGAHAGGGGSGGCAGTGGAPGAAGGGAFGIFIVGGSAPTITANAIQRGAGGSAGDGGIGGAGGLGGVGGAGGSQAALLCAGKAGRGGDGGNAGHGSGGGGGCGGSSYAIYTSGIGSPTYCSTNTVSGGSAGQKGFGGYSGGNSGTDGVNGVLAGCTSI